MSQISGIGNTLETMPAFDPQTDVTDADAQQFAQLVDGGVTFEEELTMQKQYDKNFQTISYLFMKGIFSHVEDEIRKQQ